MTHPNRYWLFQIAGWGAYSLAGALIGAVYAGWSPALVVGYGLFFAYSVGLTELFRQAIKRGRWLESPRPGVWLRLPAGALTIAAIQFALVVSIYGVMTGASWPADSRAGLAWAMVFVTGTWTGLYVRLTEKRRVHARETELRLTLREAELRALQRQINPHFLFNCLNSIRALVLENPERAQEMITRLAQMLRHSLHREPRDTASLATEVEVVADYLALEGVRFEDRLKVEVDIDWGARDLEVPAMLLSTLVENAVTHGIAESPAGGSIHIKAAREPRQLRIEVANTGRLAGAPADGVGLANIRERLRLLYGDGASLTMRNAAAGQVVTTVTVPLA